MSNQKIQQGAEAIIYLKNNEIIKDRIKKSYRISILDEKLRKSRTKSEAKIINKLQNIIPVPKIIKSDEKQEIVMEYINGEKLSENLEQLEYKQICKQIANNITKIHNQNIIHGDLTTSNMILKDNKIYFIDFGLAFHSQKIEDKAVDLHLLQQALEAKHFTIWQECWKIILDDYRADKYKEILQRIKAIESRGRYKDKY
ncbi:Kae1-associated serine/threonine protein kinase [Candidatus Pacearchaeota archaeon]|nr:Kae1-associated serine/threonine protein kinase [Candidatus Pacearchaeota archaeon]